MPTYTLVPDEHDYEPVEMEADSPRQVLGMVHRQGWNAARVLQDGEYAFTISLNPQGFWSIVQGLPDADMPPSGPI